MVYRNPARRDEAKEDDVREFERDVSDVEATFDFDAGPDMGINTVTMMFVGDRPAESVYLVEERSSVPQPRSGESRLYELLEQGIKREFLRLDDLFVPWHRLISVNITRRIERKTTVRWKLVEQPRTRTERG